MPCSGLQPVTSSSPPAFRSHREDVWPNKGRSSGGDRVVIRGRNLQAGEVLFGLDPAPIVSQSDEELTVTAPAEGAGEIAIAVTNLDGDYAIATSAFRYYQ